MVKVASLTGVLALAVGIAALPASANEFEPQIRDVIESQVQPWLSDPALIEAIRAQNEAHAGLSDDEIEALDQQWRAEAESGSGPLIDDVMGRDLSAFLIDQQSAADGLFTEIFVMDARGLNVGQSGLTSDYMQGDEAKWQNTYATGPNEVFIDEVEFDESANNFQSQASLSISDPDTGEAIGAITLGIAVEQLF